MSLSPASSIAQIIATRFHNDGQCWRDADDTPLSDVVGEMDHTEHRFGDSATVYEFADGSGLAVTDAGWDVVTRHEGGWVAVEADGAINANGWRFGCVDPEYLAQRQVEEDCDREAVVAEDGTVTRTRIFRCWDDSGTEIDIEAPNADEAAQEYVDGGDWGEQSKTWWCSVTTVELVEGEPDDDTRESHTIAVEPDEPKCSAGEHDWRSPFAIVGGIKENPGVFGHGGGVNIHEVCVHCGCGRVTDTWAQNPVNGEQGLRSVEYHAGKYADEVAALASEEE